MRNCVNITCHIYIPEYSLRNKINTLAEKQNKMHYTDFYMKTKNILM